MSVLRCPIDHARTDPAAEVGLMREWADATSWINVRERLLAEGRCPACPGAELQRGMIMLYGRQHRTDRCPCCAAVWVSDEHGWKCLDTGKLI